MTAVGSAVPDRSLEQRIAARERIESIKGLKYRYWRACDAMDPGAFRALRRAGQAPRLPPRHHPVLGGTEAIAPVEKRCQPTLGAFPACAR